MNRVISIARIQLIAWPAFLWPIGIMATSLLINIALFTAIGDRIPAGDRFTGGLSSIYIVQFIVCTQAMTQVFSFAVGLNATRRAFYLGTALVAVGQSFGYGVLLYVLKLVEHATNGWGAHVGFFDLVSLTHSNSPTQILVYAVPMALFSVAGMFCGVVSKRWGSNGILTLSLAVLIGIGAAAVLITWGHAWSRVGGWFVSQPGLAVAAGWTLLPVAALAAGTYALNRRAVP